MRRYGYHWFLVLTLLIMGACAVLPQTPKEQVAVGYSTLITLRQTTTSLLKSGQITVAEAKTVAVKVDTARSALDIASVALGQGQDATATIASAQQILDALTVYLKSKGGT